MPWDACTSGILIAAPLNGGLLIFAVEKKYIAFHTCCQLICKLAVAEIEVKCKDDPPRIIV